MIILTSLGSLACALSSDQFKPIRTKIYRQIKLKNKQFSCRTSLWPLIITEARIFLPKLIYSLVYMGYIETGDKTSVDVLTWVVLHSLITYERTREHFLCGQTAFLRVRLGKCHWIVLLNGSKLHQGPVSYILLQRGGRIPVFFFFFFFLPGSLSKGFALFGFHSAVCRQIAYGIMHRRHQLFENRENSKIKARWWRGERRVFNLHRQT